MSSLSSRCTERETGAWVGRDLPQVLRQGHPAPWLSPSLSGLEWWELGPLFRSSVNPAVDETRAWGGGSLLLPLPPSPLPIQADITPTLGLALPLNGVPDLCWLRSEGAPVWGWVLHFPLPNQQQLGAGAALEDPLLPRVTPSALTRQA